MCYPHDRNMRSTAIGACALFGSVALVGCSASESRSPFGQPTDGGSRGEAGDEVVLPDEDAGADVHPRTDDGFVQPKCGGALKESSNGAVCVRVLKGADGPHIDSVSRALRIDGEGVLVVALMPDPWLRTSKPLAVRTFPSASSSTHFVIATDLPKIAELEVPPGHYLAMASFYDQPVVGSRDYTAGDFLPKMEGGWVGPKVEVSAGGAMSVEIQLFPVRQVDVTTAARSTLRPFGSGSGPLRVSLWNRDPFLLLGDGRLKCADVFATKPVVRVITTAEPGVYGARAALYDFAAGPDDPVIDDDGAPPSGAIVDYDGTTAPASIAIADGWVSPSVDLTLDRVVPFASTIPVDPTPSCMPYSAAPMK